MHAYAGTHDPVSISSFHSSWTGQLRMKVSQMGGLVNSPHRSCKMEWNVMSKIKWWHAVPIVPPSIIIIVLHVLHVSQHH